MTLTGTGFTGTELTVEGILITPTSLTDTQLVFVAPAHDNGIASVKLSGNGPNAYAEFLYLPPPLKILPAGYITTVMGVGQFRGNGRPATNAMIDAGSASLAIGSDGALYISEPSQNTVRRIRPDGVIEAYAGRGLGTCCNLGDGGPALAAYLSHPRGIDLDPNGNLFLADSLATSSIRRVDAHTGIITTVAGGLSPGFSGDGGPASQAQLNDPLLLAFDGAGNLFVLDWGNVRIRRIDTHGIITTIAGTGVVGDAGDGGPAASATFNIGVDDGGGLAADRSGNVYLADSHNGRVRRIDALTGIITPFANGVGDVDAVATDVTGNVYVGSNYYSDTRGRVLKFSPSGTLLQGWGSGLGFSPDGSPAASSPFGNVQRIRIDASGNIVFAEYDSSRIRRINITTGLLETVAGMGPNIIGKNGSPLATVLNDPGTDFRFLADGEIVTAEGGSNIVRRVDLNGIATPIAGDGLINFTSTPPSSPALQVAIYPGSVAVAPDGDIYIVNGSGADILRLDRRGTLRAVTSNSGGFSGDGGPASAAALANTGQIAFDEAGNLFIADTGNNRIRRIDGRTGIITTVAGNGSTPDCGDGGPAVNACLNTPYGVAVDTDGSFYIGEGDQTVRRVDPSGMISTLHKGNGSGPGNFLAINPAHNIFVSPFACRLEPSGHWYCPPFRGFGPPGIGDGGPVSQANQGAGDLIGGIATDSEGNLIFTDGIMRRIRAIRFGAVISESGSTVNATGGSFQNAPEAGAFSNALQATVNSPDGNLENGIRVDFTAPTTGPSCAFPNGKTNYSVLTDLNGVASARCAANKAVGSYSVFATPLALGSAATFSLTNLAAPVVNLSPAFLLFGNQAVGTTSASKSIVLTNSGAVALAITSISVSGSFNENNNCGTSLSAGSSCSINVTFAPTTSGWQRGTLSITDNSGDSPHKVSLLGTTILSRDEAGTLQDRERLGQK